MKEKIIVALTGNPNSGKTTVFNALTGAHQHVGNYPGVTVEKKEGVCTHKGYEITFVDLPGTYSLTAYSVEEVVARNFIIDEHPDVVVDIVDSSNLERNLYLATQLMEMRVPLVLAFNMADIVEQRGIEFDNDKLSGFFKAPIVPTVGNKGKGMDELLDVIVETAQSPGPGSDHILHYGEEVEQELSKIEKLVGREHELVNKYGSRWLALKLLEQDKDILDKGHSEDVIEAVAKSVEYLTGMVGDEPQIIIAERRYGFISGACEESVKSSIETRHTRSDITDKIILNRVLGLPIFAGLMYLVFKLTFWIGDPLMGWIEGLFEWLAGAITGLWPEGADSVLQSLLVDGIIGGVGGVIVFLPNILLLFLAIAILEDTGYMARAAFIMDRIMHKIGLHGKSFIPMLIGFGCSIPAIMATRVLENRRNRLTTIMVVPLMSCGARLPIYALIIPAFFAPRWHGFMLWLIYMIGIVLAIICAKLLRVTLFKGETTPFVMELPPYRIPTIKGIVIHMWERAWLYMKKAGTIILAISIILWAATSYPKPSERFLVGLDEEQAQEIELTHSIAGRVGKAFEPVIRPLGFDWRVGTALIGALGAKEVFVAQMGIVHSLGEADEASEVLRAKLQAEYSPLVGFCIMLFTLISAPCVATLAICRRETNSWGWAMFQFFGLTATAYVITLIVYQVGSLIMT
ncbi:MAG: ferrous iron transport protein B [Planctomycetes bacterium]|nr:ferrous iron transport protein B [Planctomycetota bacterium]MBL7147110.1 ferrous iron transport protein B [Phycisphaerae bacterium]